MKAQTQREKVRSVKKQFVMKAQVCKASNIYLI